jgi:hypothetical protein
MLGKDWVVCRMLQKLLLQTDTGMISNNMISSGVRHHQQKEQQQQVAQTQQFAISRLSYPILTNSTTFAIEEPPATVIERTFLNNE